MADEKKKPEGDNLNVIESALLLLLLLGALSSIATVMVNYFTSSQLSFFGFKLSGIFNFFQSNSLFFRALGIVLAGGAAVGTFVYNRRADAIWQEIRAAVYPDPKDMKISSAGAEPAKNPMEERWARIISLSESTNSSDWRLAIIEADIILDELLQKLQLPGETMGEKMKAVEKSDFTTIESAWEAHKARNMIAHEGSGFLINQHEIRRIISLYEAVFKEFHLI